MVAIMTDLTVATNDHAWTRQNDMTTPTTSESTHPEHPSDLLELNKNGPEALNSVNPRILRRIYGQ